MERKPNDKFCIRRSVNRTSYRHIFIKVPNHHIFDFSGLLKFRSQSMQLPKPIAEGFQGELSKTSASDSVLTSTPVWAMSTIFDRLCPLIAYSLWNSSSFLKREININNKTVRLIFKYIFFWLGLHYWWEDKVISN